MSEKHKSNHGRKISAGAAAAASLTLLEHLDGQQHQAWTVDAQLEEVNRLKANGFLDAFPLENQRNNNMSRSGDAIGGGDRSGGKDNIFEEMKSIRDEQADVFAQLMDVEVGFERHVLYDKVGSFFFF